MGRGMRKLRGEAGVLVGFADFVPGGRSPIVVRKEVSDVGVVVVIKSHGCGTGELAEWWPGAYRDIETWRIESKAVPDNAVRVVSGVGRLAWGKRRMYLAHVRGNIGSPSLVQCKACPV